MHVESMHSSGANDRLQFCQLASRCAISLVAPKSVRLHSRYWMSHRVASIAERIKVMTTTTHSSTRKFGLALIAAVFAAIIASPALAESAYSPDVSAKSRHARKHQAPSVHLRGRAAYGSAQMGGLDSNSPEMTGGGSIGYNRKLLEF